MFFVTVDDGDASRPVEQKPDVHDVKQPHAEPAQQEDHKEVHVEDKPDSEPSSEEVSKQDSTDVHDKPASTKIDIPISVDNEEKQSEVSVGDTQVHIVSAYNDSSHYQEDHLKAGVVEEKSQRTLMFGTSNKGAVIALSLGLVISALLLFFVGCRLRTVKKRLRRGRPLNSNEADYLINGMYL